MSKSKEEIILEHSTKRFDRDKFPKGYPWVSEAMDEHAKNQSIAFRRWVNEQSDKSVDILKRTDDQLYDLFIQSKTTDK